MKRVLTLALLSLVALGLSAQINLYGLHFAFVDPADPMRGGWEQFVQVNPYTGSYVVLDTIWGVEGVVYGTSSFNQAAGKYIFWGIDGQGGSSLYEVDRSTGAALAKGVQNNRIPLELQFDMRTGELFGLYWDNASQQELLLRVNLQTGTSTTVSTLSGVKYIVAGSSALDDNRGRYYFVGIDGANVKRLYRVATATGTVLSQPLLNTNLYELEFDVSQKKLYGLHRPSQQAPVSLVEIDTLTGATSPVCTINSLNGQFAGIAGGAVVFDQNSHTYIFRGINASADSLFFVDVGQGSYRSIPSPGNVIEIECDNTAFAKRYFSSTTRTEALLPSFAFGPNPVEDWLLVTLPPSALPGGQLRLMDIEGRVLKESAFSGFRPRVFLGDLPAGSYLLTLKVGSQTYRARLVKR